jgi:exopolysaccharide biosynthesis polyprenyl glycosylphosphotransferase
LEVEAELRPPRRQEEAAINEKEKIAATESDELRVVHSVEGLTVVRDGNSPSESLTKPIRSLESSSAATAGNLRLRLLAISFMQAGTDILSLAAALLFADWLIGEFRSFEIGLGLVALAATLWVAVFNGFRLYSTRHLSGPEEFRRLISATSVAVLLLVVASMGQYSTFSRSWIGLIWFLALAFEMGTRRLWRAYLFGWRSGSELKYRTLVVGTGEEARHLHEVLSGDRAFIPVGHISLNGFDREDSMGPLDDIVGTVRKHQIDCLFVPSSEVDQRQMVTVRRAARVAGVDLRVSANMPDTLSTRLSLQPVGDVMTISLRLVRLTGIQAAIKRTFDFVLAGIGLLLTLPLIGMIALAIRWSSTGPVLFKQERITSGGRAFTMYKFRTMVRNADQLLQEQQLDTSEAFFKLQGASAVTPVGRILRKFSLDELPQLWNILKGEMSLVGPRPLPVEQVAANLELLEYRHDVRAGLTGWWQINGRSDVDAESAVRMDLFYIENWSVALDLYILLKTVGVFLLRRGAY